MKYMVLSIIVFAVWFAMLDRGPDGKLIRPPAVVQEKDGSVRQINEWIDKHVADPRAQVTKWEPLERTEEGFKTSVLVRARNAVGGWLIKEFYFTIDEAGNITSALDEESMSKLKRPAVTSKKVEEEEN